MRYAPRLVLILLSSVVLLGFAADTASATSIEDLIKLKANKTAPVSDDVLIALIESDGSVFHLTADDIVPLKQKGLSERVIIAMLLTAKRARPAVDVVEPPLVDQRESVQPGPGIAVVPPVAVNVTQSNVQTVEQPRPRYERRTEYVPVYVPVAVPVVRQPPPQPVYWGFGGQRRPDTWAPAPDAPKTTPDRKPATQPDPKKGGGAQ
jgi:hypothetical protein